MSNPLLRGAGAYFSTQLRPGHGWAWLLPRLACGAATALLLLAGCAGGPEARIRRNPEVFAGFPPEIQEKVRRGEIELGFTPAMVQMAVGRPQRVNRRLTASGAAEIWVYVSTYVTHDRVWRDSPRRVLIRDAKGVREVWMDEPGMVSVSREHEYERLRLEFSNGRLSSIETADR